MKKLLIILTFFMLAGCGAKALVDNKAATSSISSSEYAYVLIGYQSCASSAWIHTSRSYFEKGDKNLFDFIRIKPEGIGSAWGINWAESYHLFNLIPGKYTLTDFNYASMYMSHGAIEINESVKHQDSLLGEFNVKKGELTYIGSLYFEAAQSAEKTIFTVTDKRGDAVKFMKENYPGIDTDIMVYSPIKPGMALRDKQ